MVAAGAGIRCSLAMRALRLAPRARLLSTAVRNPPSLARFPPKNSGLYDAAAEGDTPKRFYRAFAEWRAANPEPEADAPLGPVILT